MSYELCVLYNEKLFFAQSLISEFKFRVNCIMHEKFTFLPAYLSKFSAKIKLEALEI